jgi:hypothetical protein
MQIFFFSEKKTFIFLCSDILPLCPSQFQSSSDVTTTTLKKKLAMGISLQLFQDQIYQILYKQKLLVLSQFWRIS